MEREEIHCPHCQSTRVRRISLYGSQLMTSQYRCDSCQSLFERIRHGDDAHLPRTPTPAPGEPS